MDATKPDLMRAIRGPVLLIATGTLFALDHFTRYGIQQTWPVLLIVFGVVSLLARNGGGKR